MKKIFMILLMCLFIFSCGKKEKPLEVIEEKSQQENLFKNIDVDKLSKRLTRVIQIYGMKVDNFEDLSSDGKVYYYSTLNNNEDEIITINYENLTPTAIVGKVISKNEEKIEIFKNLSLAIIKSSDTNLTDEDAQFIFEKLLEQMDKSISVTVTGSNNLTYGIEIIGVEDAMIFYVK